MDDLTGTKVGNFNVLRAGPKISQLVKPKNGEPFRIMRQTWVLECDKCKAQMLHRTGKEPSSIDLKYVNHKCYNRAKKEKTNGQGKKGTRQTVDEGSAERAA